MCIVFDVLMHIFALDFRLGTNLEYRRFGPAVTFCVGYAERSARGQRVGVGPHE